MQLRIKGRFYRLMQINVALLAVLIFLAGGFLDAAQAASPAMDASCSQMSTYGFTQGLVYCVQASIGVAVNQYVPVMQTKLKAYEAMAIMVAVAIFGIKMMQSNMQEPVKEVATIVFRLLIGVFFYSNAILIYNDIAGTLPANNGIINQMIGWVTGFSSASGGGGSGNNIFGSIIAKNCNVDAPAHPFEGFQIWQAFDCMFSEVLGAANPVKHPYAFFTSILTIVAASLFSATLGVIATGLGISMFLGILLFICRALFLVLTSYLCIGFMAIFAPLIAPLIFFESQFLNQKFRQWLGIIISSIFQPVFVVGFLGLAIAVDDQVIEGNIPGCTPPTAITSGATQGNAPSTGWGQDGTGVCSFTQLINAMCPAGSGASGNTAAQQTCFFNFMEQNKTLFEENAQGSPQGHKTKTAPAAPVNYDNDPIYGHHVANNDSVYASTPAAQGGAVLEAKGTTLKNIFPLKQLLLTMLTFIFINYAIKGLMEKIPAIAASMTIETGVGLMEAMQLPFEESIDKFLTGANDSMMKSAQGKGLLSGNLKGPQGYLQAAADGMRGGIGNMVRK